MAELAALLDAMPLTEARAALTRCCGATRWVEGMLARRPFVTDERVFSAAEDAWRACSDADVREAFTHHPRIGADLTELRRRFQSTAAWSGAEQSGMFTASDATLVALRTANDDYCARFGYIFIVCASGKGADEMLAIVRARLSNDPARELSVAAAEQAKITAIRLRKLVP